MTNFGQLYSSVYDLIYKQKNYRDEVYLLDRIFKKYGTTPIKSILEFGCGTGGHTLFLASLGYEIVAVDLSKWMLEIAKRKLFKSVTKTVHFLEADIKQLGLSRKFDAVISMFGILDYQTSTNDVVQFFNTSRFQSNDGSLLVFDFWYGPAVLKIQPERRIAKFETDTFSIVRVAEPFIMVNDNTVLVNYTLELTNKLSKKVETYVEKHKMRYFFRDEIEFWLYCSGFELLNLSTVQSLESKVDHTTWNAMVVARAL